MLPRLLILTLLLVAACSRGGDRVQEPRPITVLPTSPCLTREPPRPSDEAVARLKSGELTPQEENDFLWTYVEVLERRVRLDWLMCGPSSVSK